MTNYYDQGWQFGPFTIDPLESTEVKRAEYLAHIQDEMSVSGAGSDDIADSLDFANEIFGIDDNLQSGAMSRAEAVSSILDMFGVDVGMSQEQLENYVEENWDSYSA